MPGVDPGTLNFYGVPMSELELLEAIKTGTEALHADLAHALVLLDILLVVQMMRWGLDTWLMIRASMQRRAGL